jgi:hypothetical protein
MPTGKFGNKSSFGASIRSSPSPVHLTLLSPDRYTRFLGFSGSSVVRLCALA